MASSSYSATELKYAASSSWTSGKARQGVYSSTRYEGAIRFSGLADLRVSNIDISQIQLKVTFGPAGGESTKYLTFYKATKDAISGSIASMRGTSIGAVTVGNAYNRTVTLTFNSSTNAGIYNTLRSYFGAGNQTLIIYVPTTRGKYSKGFCYDYLSITSATLTLTYEYLQSDGSLASTSVTAGSTAKLNITAYNSNYSHKVKWTFGSYSATQTIAAGGTSASYTIPMEWLNAIPSAVSGSASATLETLDANGTSLGSYTYGFTISAPTSVVPSISSVTASPINSNSTIASWGIYVYGKSQARIILSGASGIYGSTIRSYSITTSPNVGTSSSSTLTTATLYSSGTITVTAKVTDSRGRTATKTTTFYIYGYSPPYFSTVEAFRCTSSGVRNDTSGTYASIRATFGCNAMNGSNKASAQLTMEQIGGSYSTASTINSGATLILGEGKLASDAAYLVTLRVTDTIGTASTYSINIQSAAYLLHFKKGGKAIGIGKAAGDDYTISLGWPLKLTSPLEVSQGGTGASSATAACTNIGAVSKTGGTMTGNLMIQTDLYPSLYLLPTHNGTTNRTVFEGSYVGASSFSSWEDNTGNNRRMLEVRTAAYAPSMDNAVVLRTVVKGTYSTYRLFHSGMASPIPVSNGGTGGSTAKDALRGLGIFYADSLPSSGSDGQICLVPAT